MQHESDVLIFSFRKQHNHRNEKQIVMNARYLLQEVALDGRMYHKHLIKTGHESSSGSG
jgi:hypothetical protein